VGASLNEKQNEAMSRVKGPLAVTAGPGSGKTNMLTSRIASLIIDHKVPSHQVMAVTFTNKAAKEMRERVGKLIGVDMKAITSWSTYTEVPEIGTFHSICLRILRQEMIYTPFNSSFSIYDDSDQLKLVKGVLVNLGIKTAKDIEDEEEDSEGAYTGTKREVVVDPDRVQKAINNAKCDALEPEDYGIPESAAYDPKIASFAKIYQQYQKELFANNALDFGEIICMTYRLLRDNKGLREKYQEKFHYIHVDEFQDTNKAQYLWLLMLAGKDYGGKNNICVVGDEDQSVYGWRGAKASNMMNFENDFPTSHHVKLEQNYRSTQKILNAANHLIKFNVERKDKTLWTENDEGQNIIIGQLEDDKGEAEAVVLEVKRLINLSINQAKLNKGTVRTYADFCILYRTNALSQAFEVILRREKIPYEITKGLRFYDRAEIKDIIGRTYEYMDDEYRFMYVYKYIHTYENKCICLNLYMYMYI
jgi:DNA helicase-2/ATP-dependent DNA helicase PcrA